MTDPKTTTTTTAAAAAAVVDHRVVDPLDIDVEIDLSPLAATEVAPPSTMDDIIEIVEEGENGSICDDGDNTNELSLPKPLHKIGRNDTGSNGIFCHTDRCVVRTLFVILLLALSGLVFAIVRFTQASKNDTNNANTATKPHDDTSLSSSSSSSLLGMDAEEYRDNILSVLHTRTSSTGAFFEPNSPQSQTIDWLIFEDIVLKTDAVVATQGRYFVDDPDPLLQRYAVMVLYFATNGQLWDLVSPWADNGDVHECNFIGIECNDDGRIYVIDLSRRKLRGQLPEEVGSILTDLLYLLLGDNFLEGSIPSTYYNGLSNLEAMDLQFNDLKFRLTDDVGKLSRLTALFLNGQPVGGSLPPRLDMLRSLEILDLSSTQVSGPITDFFPYWTNLTDLSLTSSETNGTIPGTIAETNPNLRSLQLEGTHIDAAMFPTEIGLLSNLEGLFANVRSGSPDSLATFPTHLGQLTNLEHLWLRGENKGYYGTLPTELGKLTKLLSLHIEDTSLSGQIPSEIASLTSLTSLLLAGNNFSGTLPTDFGKLHQLSILGLAYNDLSGTFPSGICDPSPPRIIQYDCTMMKCSCCRLPCQENRGRL